MTSRGWDAATQSVRRSRSQGAASSRAAGSSPRPAPQFADYALYWKPGIPVAIVEAKAATQSVGAGMHQDLRYADMLDVPFVFSTNGEGFLVHDRAGEGAKVETSAQARLAHRRPLLTRFPCTHKLCKR